MKINKHLGFTIAEVLVTFIILAIIAIAIPVTTQKTFKAKNVRHPHGRYECWLNNSGELMEYQVQESADGHVTVISDKVINNSNNIRTIGGVTRKFCVFQPPKNVSYILINAVGAGGGGASLRDTVEVEMQDKYYSTEFRKILATENEMQNKTGNYNLLPEWFKEYHEIYCGKNPSSALCTENISINTLVKYDRAKLIYEYGGYAGKIVSMFSTQIPNNKKLYIMPGEGGKVVDPLSGFVGPLAGRTSADGGDGQDTLIEIVANDADPKLCFNDSNYCNMHPSVSSQPACCNFVKADGGKGGVANDAYISVTRTGGGETDLGISNYKSVKGQEVDFNSVLDDDPDNTLKPELKSKLRDKNLGNGGNGANQVLGSGCTAGTIDFSSEVFGDVTYKNEYFLASDLSVSNPINNIAKRISTTSLGGSSSKMKKVIKSFNKMFCDKTNPNCVTDSHVNSCSRNGDDKFECTSSGTCDKTKKNQATEGKSGGVVILW